MKAINFQIQVGIGWKWETERTYRVVPGLVVHRTQERVPGGIKFQSLNHSWKVSHEHSGLFLNIVRLKTRQAAIEMALKLAALANWDRPLGSVKDLGISDEVQAQIEAIIGGRLI